MLQLTYSSYEDALPDNCDDCDCDDCDNSSEEDDDDENVMWIILVSVMGVIILAAAFVIFLMWWYLIRPYEYKTMIEESGTSQENLRDAFQDYQIESSPPTAPFEDTKSKRESVNISGTTEMGM